MDKAARLVGLVLVVFAAVIVVLLQYMVAVFWLEGRNERDLARQGIVMGGDALNQAVLPALWLTVAVVAVDVIAIVLVLRRHRRQSQPRVSPDP